MAKVRRWLVEPDEVRVTQEDEIPCVSRDAMVRAIMDGESVLAVMGGIVEVRVKRQRTDLPGEAVTTLAVVAWYESDAARAMETVSTVHDAAVDALAAEPEGVEVLDVEESPDGLDPSTLEEEDVSSIPEAVR